MTPYSSIVALIALSLAVWRISSIVYDEDGPYNVFRHMRRLLGILHDEQGVPFGYPRWLEWMDCFWCIALMVSILVVTPLCIAHKCGILESAISTLSVSTGAIITERWIGRSKARY